MTRPPAERPSGVRKTGRARWCGGHVGREHQPSEPHLDTRWALPERQVNWTNGRTFWICHHIVTCMTCGRILDRLRSDRCPARQEDS